MNEVFIEVSEEQYQKINSDPRISNEIFYKIYEIPSFEKITYACMMLRLTPNINLVFHKPKEWHIAHDKQA